MSEQNLAIGDLHNDHLNDDEAMSLAIHWAAKGHGWVSPNPPVGCVILDKDRRLIGQGYHHRFGGDHAEIDALKSVQDPQSLEGSFWYVTLEPCAHEGKTPSCAKKLAELPIQRLIYGVLDPNPLVAGQGLKILREAGVEVALSELSQACAELTEIFLYNMKHRSCFVTLKLASTLDGQLCLKNGESQWITNKSARHFAQLLRSQYDAVLVGANTVLNDNPKLNIRLKGYEKHTNHVVIIDPEGRTLSKLENSDLVRVRSKEKVVVLTQKGVAKKNDSKVEVVSLPGSSVFSWKDIKNTLYQKGIYSVFVEGGAFVASSLLESQEFQRLYLLYGNKIIGSSNGRSWSQSISERPLDSSLSLNDVKYKVLDDNFLVTGTKSLDFDQ